MKKRNIFQNRSQQLLRLFEKAGNRLKMMCIPIDYAKKDHMVMFCNGYGDILRKPFLVKNTLDGIKYLIDQVMRSCRQRHIKKEYVFFGGEDVNWIFPEKVDTVKRKVSASVFHTLKDIDNPV